MVVLRNIQLLSLLMLSVSAELLLARPNSHSFTNAYNSFFLQEKAEPSTNLQQKAKKYRYIFVAGFLNEKFSNYFSENMYALTELGVPSAQIRLVRPSSEKSVEENVDFVQNEIEHEYRKDPSLPLVVIAHSKGAFETLLAGITYNDFAENSIHSLYLINGAFRGSPLADYIMAPKAQALNSSLPWWVREGMEALRSNLDYLEVFLNLNVDSGLHSLTVQSASQLWERVKGRNSENIKKFSPKVFYICSKQNPQDLALKLRVPGEYMATQLKKASDGVVLLESQSLPELGTHLATIQSDHATFVQSFGNKDPYKYRRSLIWAIINGL